MEKLGAGVGELSEEGGEVGSEGTGSQTNLVSDCSLHSEHRKAGQCLTSGFL